ncbi:hypothetical protein C1H76_0268 [Elsinoe australis]|uniref:Uncharacterized protein n=1 Tax=Elsinoe australis TaxID=40998 RepID=A0A4U7BBC5_9PEZI|nr:hypothetical protein C1H76_0268 [Elsinoe australis]
MLSELLVSRSLPGRGLTLITVPSTASATSIATFTSTLPVTTTTTQSTPDVNVSTAGQSKAPPSGPGGLTPQNAGIFLGTLLGFCLVVLILTCFLSSRRGKRGGKKEQHRGSSEDTYVQKKPSRPPGSVPGAPAQGANRSVPLRPGTGQRGPYPDAPGIPRHPGSGDPRRPPPAAVAPLVPPRRGRQVGPLQQRQSGRRTYRARGPPAQRPEVEVSGVVDLKRYEAGLPVDGFVNGRPTKVRKSRPVRKPKQGGLNFPPAVENPEQHTEDQPPQVPLYGARYVVNDRILRGRGRAHSTHTGGR